MYSEELTASRAQVLDGYTAVTKDSGDEATEGTMVNRGAVSHSLAINGSYTIPQGYHNGSGRVSQSIPTQGAKTITPNGSTQTVASGRYLTGAITVPGFSMPAANLIKKGAKITIYGQTVTGTFEGYVASNKDIYNRGTWGSGYSLSTLKAVRDDDAEGSYSPPNLSINGPSIVFKIGSTLYYDGGFIITKAINLSAYTTVNVVGNWESSSSTAQVILGIYDSANPLLGDRDSIVKHVYDNTDGINEVTFSLNISEVNQNAYVGFGVIYGTRNSYLVKRIYFT